jgi:hypothetical protein
MAGVDGAMEREQLILQKQCSSSNCKLDFLPRWTDEKTWSPGIIAAYLIEDSFLLTMPLSPP